MLEHSQRKGDTYAWNQGMALTCASVALWLGSATSMLFIRAYLKGSKIVYNQRPQIYAPCRDMGRLYSPRASLENHDGNVYWAFLIFSYRVSVLPSSSWNASASSYTPTIIITMHHIILTYRESTCLTRDPLITYIQLEMYKGCIRMTRRQPWHLRSPPAN